MNNLDFCWAERKIKISANQQPRKYLDFIIDRKSLKDLLNRGNADLISPFGWAENKAYEKEILREYRLQKPPELQTGRIMVYVCPECEDVGCGAITFAIKDLGDRIQWLDFGYENLFEEVETISFPVLEFSRQQYFNALQVVQKSIDHH